MQPQKFRSPNLAGKMLKNLGKTQPSLHDDTKSAPGCGLPLTKWGKPTTLMLDYSGENVHRTQTDVHPQEYKGEMNHA